MQGVRGVVEYSYTATPENLRNPLLTIYWAIYWGLYSLYLPTISLGVLWGEVIYLSVL